MVLSQWKNGRIGIIHYRWMKVRSQDGSGIWCPLGVPRSLTTKKDRRIVGFWLRRWKHNCDLWHSLIVEELLELNKRSDGLGTGYLNSGHLLPRITPRYWTLASIQSSYYWSIALADLMSFYCVLLSGSSMMLRLCWALITPGGQYCNL